MEDKTYPIICIYFQEIMKMDTSLQTSTVFTGAVLRQKMFLNNSLSIACRIGEGNGSPLQCSCLENPMEGGAWQAAFMGLLGVGHDLATSLSLFTFMHWRRKQQPTPVLLPGESQGQGSLVGCRLWGRIESDTTEATQQQWQQIHLLIL